MESIIILYWKTTMFFLPSLFLFGQMTISMYSLALWVDDRANEARKWNGADL